MRTPSRVQFLSAAVMAVVLVQVADPIGAGQKEQTLQANRKDSKYYIYVNGIT